ncbi:hypothetical protein [Flavobacterium sp. HNIBRBA15423]|uniref:hypothetical protein n=1 Tax=Flavobacterium sp. HNIBRBA15423 TaxID=3458683 RepID=UPI00404430A8
MSVLKNGITVLGSNYFEVINEITIKTTEVVNRTKVLYDLVFKKKDYDIVEINRLKFKVNEKEIENKFLTTVNYEEHTLNMIESNMKCKIKLGKCFEYEEVISIKSLSVV